MAVVAHEAASTHTRSRRASTSTHLTGTDPRGLLLDQERELHTAPAAVRQIEAGRARSEHSVGSRGHMARRVESSLLTGDLGAAAAARRQRAAAGAVVDVDGEMGVDTRPSSRERRQRSVPPGMDEEEWEEQLGWMLYKAAEAGDADEVRRLVAEEGAPVNYRRGGLLGQDTTPLIAAARTGRAVACAALIELGASAAYKDAKWWTALHYACTATAELPPAEDGVGSDQRVALSPVDQPPDPRGVVEVLLAGGAAVHVPDHTGCTPLHLAARRGLIQTIRTILASSRSGSGVHQSLAQANTNGDLPTHVAARHGHADIVALLLSEAREAEAEVARVEADAARAEALDAQLEEEAQMRAKIRAARKEHKAKAAAELKSKRQRKEAAAVRERMLKDLEDDLRSVGTGSVGERSAGRAASVVSGTTKGSARTGSSGPRNASGRIMSKEEVAAVEAADRAARRRRRAKKRAMRQASAVTVRAHVNWKNITGETPLHEAARAACPFAVEKLLEIGSDPLVMSKRRETPLRLAKTALLEQPDDADALRTVELLEAAHEKATEDAEKRRLAPRPVERELGDRPGSSPLRKLHSRITDSRPASTGSPLRRAADSESDGKGIEDDAGARGEDDRSPALKSLRERALLDGDDVGSLISAGRPGTPLAGAIREDDHGDDRDELPGSVDDVASEGVHGAAEEDISTAVSGKPPYEYSTANAKQERVDG